MFRALLVILAASMVLPAVSSADSGDACSRDAAQSGGPADAGLWSLVREGDFRRDGWWQDGPPDWMTGPALFPAFAVAASSAACLDFAGPDLRASALRCAGGYESVHLHISLDSRGALNRYARIVAQEDPWWNAAPMHDRVFYVQAEDIREIRKAVQNLVAGCKVASFVDVSSHGFPGGVLYGEPGDNHGDTLTRFLREGLSPCVLAPGAKVQFNGCDLACRSAAGPLGKGLEKIFLDPRYASWPGARPFEGVELSLPTDSTTYTYNEGWRRLFGPHASIRPQNGVSAVFSIRGASLSRSSSTAQIPECSQERLQDPVLPEAFRRLERGE